MTCIVQSNIVKLKGKYSNLMNFRTSVKTVNKKINHDLKILSNWIDPNEIFLNLSKTELFMFNPPCKQPDYELKVKLNGEKLYQRDPVKYLGIHINKSLTYKHHIDNVAIKLSKANAMLSKIRS